MSAAAARESGAAQEAHRFLEEAKQAMVRAAADNETTLNAWCSRQAAEIDARQTEHDKWLGECQQTAAEAERLSIQLPQEAERKAQAILDAAQEQIAAGRRNVRAENAVYFTDLTGHIYSTTLDGFHRRDLYTGTRAFTGIVYVPGAIVNG